tara:strand:- start:156 stop:368 length:213 start_codon:yes stop_codon:yes gene_type:complete
LISCSISISWAELTLDLLLDLVFRLLAAAVLSAAAAGGGPCCCWLLLLAALLLFVDGWSYSRGSFWLLSR